MGGAAGHNQTSTDAGWSSLVARRAHNPKVAGSNPAPATKEIPVQKGSRFGEAPSNVRAIYQGSTTRTVGVSVRAMGFVYCLTESGG